MYHQRSVAADCRQMSLIHWHFQLASQQLSCYHQFSSKTRDIAKIAASGKLASPCVGHCPCVHAGFPRELLMCNFTNKQVLGWRGKLLGHQWSHRGTRKREKRQKERWMPSCSSWSAFDRILTQTESSFLLNITWVLHIFLFQKNARKTEAEPRK